MKTDSVYTRIAALATRIDDLDGRFDADLKAAVTDAAGKRVDLNTRIDDLGVGIELKLAARLEDIAIGDRRAGGLRGRPGCHAHKPPAPPAAAAPLARGGARAELQSGAAPR